MVSFQSIIFECQHLIHSPHSRSLVPGGRRQDDLRVTDTATAAAVAEIDVVHGGRVAAEDDQRLERRHNEHDYFRAVGHSQRAAVPAELDARDLQVMSRMKLKKSYQVGLKIRIALQSKNRGSLHI